MLWRTLPGLVVLLVSLCGPWGAAQAQDQAERPRYGFLNPLYQKTSGQPAQLRQAILHDMPRVSSSGMLGVVTPDGHSLPPGHVEALKGAFVGYHTAATQTQGGSDAPPAESALQVNQVNDTYTEVFVGSTCPTKDFVLRKMAAVEKILEKIAPFKLLSDKLSEYPAIAFRLLRHNLAPTQWFQQTLESDASDPAFEALYKTPGYASLPVERPLQEHVFYVAPNKMVVTDPSHLMQAPLNAQQQQQQQQQQWGGGNASLARSEVGGQVSLDVQGSFLQLGTTTGTGGIIKMVICGIIGAVLMTWLFISVGYWLYIECLKYEEETKGCFNLRTNMMKYQPWYDIFIKVIYELDTEWPPRKSWLQSFMDGLPDVIRMAKAGAEAWGGGGGGGEAPGGGEGGASGDLKFENPLGAAFPGPKSVDENGQPKQDLSLQLDEEQLEKLVTEYVPQVINTVLDEDAKIPFTDEEKRKKAETGWRKEDEMHEAVRAGLQSLQSSFGPSYSPFGVMRYFVRMMAFLIFCDWLLP